MFAYTLNATHIILIADATQVTHILPNIWMRPLIILGAKADQATHHPRSPFITLGKGCTYPHL